MPKIAAFQDCLRLVSKLNFTRHPACHIACSLEGASSSMLKVAISWMFKKKNWILCLYKIYDPFLVLHKQILKTVLSGPELVHDSR